VKARIALPWRELFELRTVKAVEKLINRRWHLGLGYVDVLSGELRPPHVAALAPLRLPCRTVQERCGGPRTCLEMAQETLDALIAAGTPRPLQPVRRACAAGLQEIAVPLVQDGALLGALLCGGFYLEGSARGTGAAARPGQAEVWLSESEASLVADLLTEAASEMLAVLRETARERQPASELTRDYATRYSYDAIIGRSRKMQELYALLDRIAASDATVLIQGENGTGKELVARAIHYNSPRKNRRFVVQNCSAFNDNLLDSELFGHKRGAFTGAIADKQGLFEVADQGTFFLDEIGDMSPALQVKLLRVLQEGTFTPVGSTETLQVDVRIIAATNRDLKGMVDRGEFREDLYYRINVINLVLPPLRERRDDIELLVESFLSKHRRAGRRPAKRLSPACLQQLVAYDWPGNVRELENEIERLLVLSGDEPLIEPSLLSPRLRRHVPTAPAAEPQRSLPAAVRQLERTMIFDALKRHNWNKTRAAGDLKISRRNLIRLVQKYELERDAAPPATWDEPGRRLLS
jgi:transcriptional regulator with PAS, ATPase and Fis domain